MLLPRSHDVTALRGRPGARKARRRNPNLADFQSGDESAERDPWNIRLRADQTIPARCPQPEYSLSPCASESLWTIGSRAWRPALVRASATSGVGFSRTRVRALRTRVFAAT